MHVRLQACGRQRRRGRCAGGRTRAQGRRRHHRKDDHQRVRLQGGRRQPVDGHHPQSLGPVEDTRRLERGRGGQRRRWRNAVRARHRRRRVGPDPRLADGSVRGQGAVRPRAGVSRGRNADARPCRSHGPHRARCGPAAERGGGIRPARPVRRRRAGAGLPGRVRPSR